LAITGNKRKIEDKKNIEIFGQEDLIDGDIIFIGVNNINDRFEALVCIKLTFNIERSYPNKQKTPAQMSQGHIYKIKYLKIPG